ncbi:phosphoribosylformylglycinamidine cyclo-ligase [Verrucomicrobia bacterium]|nr:phosphoribosylformylglycinamidine cyclo-ligase [Verrucomicrobiota bacterium]
MARKSAYAQAGVDLELGNQVKQTLPDLLASTHRKEVLGKVGGFGGLFAAGFKDYKKPVLVSSVDGVGTKLKVAFMTGKHDTIGEDLVNHCVNDILVLGATPLFFLDYIGAGKLKPKVFDSIIRGFARGCKANGCALIGGETAQMPGFYQPGEYDVSGTIVGVVDQPRMLDGRKTKAGDVVIGLASNGLHTNGYSLARNILFEKAGLKPSTRLADLGGKVGDALMAVHLSYNKIVQRLLKRFNPGGKPSAIQSLSHITGGGFQDNIPRNLPAQLDVKIHQGAWDIPPLFQYLQSAGRIKDSEMFHVFNMGIGLTMTVRANQADSILRAIRRSSHQAWLIGEVEKGSGKVQMSH